MNEKPRQKLPRRWTVVQWANGIVDVYNEEGDRLVRGKRRIIVAWLKKFDMSRCSFEVGPTGDYMASVQVTREEFFNKNWNEE